MVTVMLFPCLKIFSEQKVKQIIVKKRHSSQRCVGLSPHVLRWTLIQTLLKVAISNYGAINYCNEQDYFLIISKLINSSI